MPWCEACDRYHAATAAPDGRCPVCGSSLAGAVAPTAAAAARAGIPWHFWVLMAAMTVYLGWRLVQLVLWLL